MEELSIFSEEGSIFSAEESSFSAEESTISDEKSVFSSSVLNIYESFNSKWFSWELNTLLADITSLVFLYFIVWVVATMAACVYVRFVDKTLGWLKMHSLIGLPKHKESLEEVQYFQHQLIDFDYEDADDKATNVELWPYASKRNVGTNTFTPVGDGNQVKRFSCSTTTEPMPESSSSAVLQPRGRSRKRARRKTESIVSTNNKGVNTKLSMRIKQRQSQDDLLKLVNDMHLMIKGQEPGRGVKRAAKVKTEDALIGSSKPSAKKHKILKIRSSKRKKSVPKRAKISAVPVAPETPPVKEEVNRSDNVELHAVLEPVESDGFVTEDVFSIQSPGQDSEERTWMLPSDSESNSDVSAAKKPNKSFTRNKLLSRASIVSDILDKTKSESTKEKIIQMTQFSQAGSIVNDILDRTKSESTKEKIIAKVLKNASNSPAFVNKILSGTQSETTKEKLLSTVVNSVNSSPSLVNDIVNQAKNETTKQKIRRVLSQASSNGSLSMEDIRELVDKEFPRSSGADRSRSNIASLLSNSRSSVSTRAAVLRSCEQALKAAKSFSRSSSVKTLDSRGEMSEIYTSFNPF